MKFTIVISLLWIFVCFSDVILGEKQDQPNVNPKLDLESSDEDSSHSSTPKYSKNAGDNQGRSNSGNSNSQGKPVSPKIQGVRVTVDTGPNGKSDGSSSKESVEILEPKKGKRVGIHTDITFELSDDSLDSVNGTDHRGRDDGEVPVFKGRDSNTNRPRRPYDPKQDHHWNNEPPQRHHAEDPIYRYNVDGGVAPIGGSSGRGDRDPYYRGFSGSDQEYYHGDGGVSGIGAGRHGYRSDPLGGAAPASSGVGSSNRRDGSGWTGYIPMTSVWTTERSYYTGGYKAYDSPRWKPCYCVSNDGRNRRDSRIGYLKVDDKLDLPYSSKKIQ